MTRGTDGESLELSLKEAVSLYLVLTANEETLDDVQRDVLARLCGRVYKQLSVEEIEDIEGFYRSL